MSGYDERARIRVLEESIAKVGLEWAQSRMRSAELEAEIHALRTAPCESCREKIAALEATVELLRALVKHVTDLVDVGETLEPGPGAAVWMSRLVPRLREIVGGRRR